MSELDILLAGAGGAFYFFFDFIAGFSWTDKVTTSTPKLDLNTTTTGVDNEASDFYAVQSMTYGGTNLTQVSSRVLNELFIRFNNLDIKDGVESSFVRVWPNPFSESFYVYSPYGKSTKFMIVDMHGRFFISDELMNRTSLLSSLSWPSGRYTLSLIDKSGKVISVSLMKK